MKKRIRAIIIKNSKILLIHRIKETKEYWVFPGGGEEEIDAGNDNRIIQRECLEELGVDIEVQHFFEEVFIGCSQERFYICSIVKGNIGTGVGPEFQEKTKPEGQYLLEWLTIEDLQAKNVLPESIKQKILHTHLIERSLGKIK